MPTLIVMEILQTPVTELNSPGCTVPKHDPISPQPRVLGRRRKSQFTKYLPRVFIRQVQSHESTSDPTKLNGTPTHGARLSGPAQARSSNGGLSDTTDISHQNGHLVTPVPEAVAQTPVVPISDQTNQSNAVHMNGRSMLSKLISRKKPILTPSQDEQPEIHMASTTAHTPMSTGAAPVSDTGIMISNWVQSTPGQVPTHGPTPHEVALDTNQASSPPAIAVMPPDQIHPPAVRVDARLDTQLVPLQSAHIYSPEKGIYVGNLHEIPPPQQRLSEWDPIRLKLCKDIRKATQALPPSVKGPQRWFEPELCMSGQLRPGLQNVVLRPTIWIRCGSSQCQKAVQRAVADLQYTRQFPVHITQHAPRPASSKRDPEGWQPDQMPVVVVQDESVLGDGGRDLMIQVQAPNWNSACGLRIQIRDTNGEQYVCKLGGLIGFNDIVLGLTTAHAILEPRLESTEDPDSQCYEPYFSFDSHNRSSPEIVQNSPVDLAMPDPLWMSAALWAARYGPSPDSSVAESSQSSATLSENMYDFALLRINFGLDMLPHNRYWNSWFSQSVDTLSRDLSGRKVSIVCSFNDVRRGQLLDGDRTIVDDAGCWETKKIQLQRPLGRGFSGTWVVDGSALVGVIVAVYDNEPYAHMLPIESVFSGIRTTIPDNLKHMEVQLLNAELLEKLKPGPPQAEELATSPVDEPTNDEIIPQSLYHQAIQDMATKKEVDQEIRVANRSQPIDDVPLGFGPFMSMCLMLFVVGLDTSTFPMIMPAITDSFNSITMIGWYGSVYFLAVGAAFPIFNGSCHIVSRRWGGKGLLALVLAAPLVFEGGSICCYLARNSALMILGRALCGTGSAGIMAGLIFMVHSRLRGRGRQTRIGVLLPIYALSRFVGPLIGAAVTDRLSSPTAWRYVFLIYLVAMAIPIIFVLTGLPTYDNVVGDYLKSRDPVQDSQNLLYRILPVIDLTLSMTATVCFELALNQGVLHGWHQSQVVSLFAAGSGGCLTVLLVKQRFPACRYSYWRYSLDVLDVLILLLSISWGASYYTFVHYMPFWLRTVRGYSPLRTGTRYLPTAAAHVFTCLMHVLALVLVYKKIWKLAPFVLIFSSLAQMALAAGLMTRFDSGTSISTLLGLQMLFGIGAGTGAFQMVWAGLTTAFRGRGTPTDVITWVSVAVFAEMLGASVGTSIAQTVFMTQLSREAKSHGSNLDYLLHSGVTNFKEGLNKEELDTAIVVFNKAITRTFYIPTAAGAWPYGLAALTVSVCIPLSPCLYFIWKRRRARYHTMDNPASLSSVERTADRITEIRVGLPADVPAELAAEMSSSFSPRVVRSAPVSETISSREHGSRPPNQSSLSHRWIIRPSS